MSRKEHGVCLGFGPFEFNPLSGRLTKHGHAIKLQPKAAAVLIALLESPGELVSRQNLQKALWPEGTYVDFDLGIKTAVKKVREALGDSADDPAYVQTVYGEGFRFMAPVAVREPAASERCSGEPSDPVATPVPMPGQAEPAHGSPAKGRRGMIALAPSAIVLALALSSSSTPSPQIRFQRRDWVVIASFDNRTGEDVLDGSMEFALASELERSSYANVAPPERIADALKLMRQLPDAKLTEELARQVAVRDGGIKAVIAGRIERFDSRYVLTVRLVQPASGQTVAAISKDSAKEHLPIAARSIAQEVRRKLGDLTPDSQAPLERATTTSLPALHAFSSAMSLVNQRKWAAGAELLEEATRQDSQFALAHIYAAHCYSNLNQPDAAAPHFKAALELAGSVSERERLFILSSYYSRFLHDDRRAAATYEALLQQYPDDYWSTNNLLLCYYRLLMGWSPEAMTVRERFMSLRPNNNDPQRSEASLELWWYYTRIKPNQAKANLYLAELKRSDGPFWMKEALLQPARDKWAAGDVDGAAQEVARLSSAPNSGRDDGLVRRLADADLSLGRMQAARAVCEDTRSPNVKLDCLLRVAYVRGDQEMAETQLRKLDSILPLAVGTGVFLAARLGRPDLSLKWAGTTPNFIDPMLILTGHPEKAPPPWPGPTGPTFFTLIHRMVLAEAQEEHSAAGAIAVLSDETAPAQLDLVVAWNWPECRMKLAALLRRHGRIDDAVVVENEIRHFLATADPDYPVLAQLKNLSR
jgi:DNA-binding winged helix-turn-helix (wHTH) protein/Tfp pilus assembly protein PilF